MCIYVLSSQLASAGPKNEISWLHNSDCKILSPFMLVSAYYHNSVNKHSMLRHMSRDDSFQMTESKVGVRSSSGN